MIELGVCARDSATGFEGVVTGRAEYLGGDISVQVTALIDGKPYAEWFPFSRLMKLETQGVSAGF